MASEWVQRVNEFILKRLIGGGLGIIFKGSGFYVTDNKSKNSGNTTPSDQSAKTESVSTKKTEPKKETILSINPRDLN